MSAQILTTVPHLLTANTGPIDKIEQQILANQEKIEIYAETYSTGRAPLSVAHSHPLLVLRKKETCTVTAPVAYHSLSCQ